MLIDAEPARIADLVAVVRACRRTLVAFKASSRHDLEAVWDLGAG